MKYLVIDIETLGLDPKKNSVLCIAAVYDDWASPIDDLKKFYVQTTEKELLGDPVAMYMNRELLGAIAQNKLGYGLNEEITENHCYSQEREWHFLPRLGAWLEGNLNVDPEKSINVAGKNFATFDRLFMLKQLNHPPFTIIKQPNTLYLGKYKTKNRVIDPAFALADFETDEHLPDTKLCMKRIGFTDYEVNHNPIQDCLNIIKMIRHIKGFKNG